MEHDVVTQAWGAVNANKDSILYGGAKAHSQPVRPCAWPLVIGPCVSDQASSFAKDVGGASCCNKRQKDTLIFLTLQHIA